ncbi:MAG: DUF362 domain-containing protein [Deltaproteobacteria bacterium]|nr:DUF362 domain-containing protein [Deltaproteobacteria bacterium]
MKKRFSRRDFIFKSLGLTGGLLFFSPENLFAKEKSVIFVAKGKDVAKTTRSCIDAIGGISKFISRNDIVVIKPNIAWDRRVEQAANTHPEVVAEMVRLAYQAGAKKVKVFDNTCDDPRRTYKTSGIADAAKKAGAFVSYVNDKKFKKMMIGGKHIKKWKVYTEVIEADKVINIPIAKQHGSAILSMALKNWFGAVGGFRGRLHWGLHHSIAEIAHFFKPTLTVMDATRILINNGPQGGSLKDVKVMDMVIASTDQVAIDAFCAKYLFGIDPYDIPYIKYANELKMGVMEIDKIKIIRAT